MTADRRLHPIGDKDSVIQGRRLPDASTESCDLPVGIELDHLRNGDYWKSSQWNAGKPVWFIFYDGVRNLVNHHVDENPDGTITVILQPGNSNSILCKNGKMEPIWHGYIRNGVWQEC